MRSSYVNSGPRSLPHMTGSKRHNGNGHGNGHSGNGHNGNGHGNGHNGNSHSGNSHSGNGHNGARLSPPMQPQVSVHNNNNNTNQHDDLINYIYESWNKVTRELERGSDDAKYYQEVMGPRQLANFRPFNLEQWWGRRLMQTINRNKHRS